MGGYEKRAQNLSAGILRSMVVLVGRENKPKWAKVSERFCRLCAQQNRHARLASQLNARIAAFYCDAIKNENQKRKVRQYTVFIRISAQPRISAHLE